MSVESERLSGFLATIPYARFLAIRTEWAGGRLLVALPFKGELIGNTSLPAIHGGVLAGFLELTALMTVATHATSCRASTVDFTVEYLRSAGPRETFAQATIKRLGRRFANVEAVAWQDAPEKPVAAISGRFSV